MTKEEQARLLEAASHCLAAAANLSIGPVSGYCETMVVELIDRGRELAAFAREGARG